MACMCFYDSSYVVYLEVSTIRLLSLSLSLINMEMSPLKDLVLDEPFSNCIRIVYLY